MMFVFVSIFNIRQFDQSNTNDSSENFKMQFFFMIIEDEAETCESRKRRCCR